MLGPLGKYLGDAISDVGAYHTKILKTEIGLNTEIDESLRSSDFIQFGGIPPDEDKSV